jgi:phage tail-like protein
MTTRREALKLAGAATVGGVAATLASGSPAGANVRAAAAATQNFSVEIDGIISTVQSVRLISNQSDVKFVPQPSGSATATPEGLAFQEIVLQRAWLSSKTDWIQWRTLVLEGKTTSYRKNVAVTIYNAESVPVELFKFSNAWPAAYVGPTLATDGSQDLVETITCVYQGLVVTT